MGNVYCLFDTNKFEPRYVGQTIREVQDRSWETIREGLEGKKRSVHKWIRSAYLAGYSVGAATLEQSTIGDNLDKLEKRWIRSLPKLHNELCQPGENISAELTEYATTKCRTHLSWIDENYQGFHGVRYHRDEDAFTVRICYLIPWGSCRIPWGSCRVDLVEGDELPGRPDDQWAYWFSDCARAIEARDQMRKQISGNSQNVEWPKDKSD